ncbi:MAG TPA: amino acid ABC transporter permease [Xanthobacteraceae bacterium]|jgi:general L-amino acid transport system permease protein|nr:amino acid ABC transporter permease [Xanthobacteraceae bacterium]
MSDIAAQTGTGAFVRRELVAASLRPPTERGLIGWARENLFSGPFNIVMTILSVLLILLIVPPLLRFMLIDAVWTGDNREACVNASGACWPFVKAKFGQFIYGFYPIAERWRPNVVFALGALLLAPLLIPRAPLKRLNAILFFGIFPLIAFVLLTGGNLDLQRFLIGRLVRFESLFDQTFLGLRVSFWIDYVLSAALLIGISAFAGRLLGGDGRAIRRSALFFFLLLALILLAFDLDFGLVPVETPAWGGLLVTLVVAVTGIVVSLPLGILLALGRRSELPAIKAFSIVFIEFWRGVPLITVLFFATYMLPLFLPGGFTINGLLRALIGVALFAAAYMAEVVRGGLQAIPKGQYEGAAALGLGYWQTMGQVVLPQALTLVIPGIVNTFIGLFKDTTLVLIVAIFDLLGQLRAAFTDPNWSTPTTLFTGFAFGAVVYFIFCFSMSRYSMFVERRLSAGKRH